MPFGCGEQNMILFAPNVFVARYLQETGQIKPEVMARAENLMITGYQRELTYRRSDGSFSAFGDNDAQGSLWLTAFVLKTFAQADGLIYIDPGVLDDAAEWIVRHQKGDGSFEPVGFLHHQELLGGLHGKNALTAYVAVALLEAGQHSAAAKAVRFLEGQIVGIEDAYGMAITTYALELADSPSAGAAYDRLMGMSQVDDDGLHWGDSPAPIPLPITPKDGPPRAIRPQPHQQSAAIETTAYATLALLEHGDRSNASSSARWLVTRRNSSGGFGSTQDTVVGLQSLTEFSAAATADVDMTVVLSAGSWQREVSITGENADVLQMFEVPEHGALDISASGKGEAVVQVVRRFNLPEVEQAARQVFEINSRLWDRPRKGRRPDYRVGRRTFHSLGADRGRNGGLGHRRADRIRPGNGLDRVPRRRDSKAEAVQRRRQESHSLRRRPAARREPHSRVRGAGRPSREGQGDHVGGLLVLQPRYEGREPRRRYYSGRGWLG